MQAKRYLLSAGGTGGHIFPALAIADALKADNPANEILFVGALGRMEMEKVPAQGYRIIGLEIAGLQRKFSFQNLLLPQKIWRSITNAKKIIRSFEPHCVIGFGGYASAPVLFAAQKLNYPTIIQEQNSYAGLTNKILAKKAKAICVAYPEMETYFNPKKVRLTGNPLRPNISKPTSKSQGLQHFSFTGSKPVMLVLGGSLGARSINSWLSQNCDLLQKTFDIIWQCGSYYFDNYKHLIQNSIQILPFISEMNLAYAAADIIVSRSGASSISELCAVAKPVVFVPSPNVAADHQTKNAKALVNKNAALIIKDAEMFEKLTDLLLALNHDFEKRNLLSANIKTLAILDAPSRILNEIKKYEK